ncbi:type II toxin-antitoxin system RelB/DinJ family antitoxin [Haloferula sargassicola]|uniref:DNA-damage-inducible protein J n=1 Tax=Haloferula sargassicola TaxID=490096 RepID=A0ABP9UMY4_9BACT
MNDTAKLQIRLDRSLKEGADEVFSELGIDAATAVRLFFTKVVKTQSIPFKLKVEPEFSPEAEARILKAWKESKDPAYRVGPFESAEDFVRYLHETADDED